jgi:phosphoribosylanthranilate isomerase
MHTWIKICGTTSLEDAQASVAAGADALGFIFAPSKRRVTPAQAGEIIRQLPEKVERVGIFVDEFADVINATVDQVGLTAVQLHGNESPEFAARLLKDSAVDRHIRVIKTVLVDDDFEARLARFSGQNEQGDPILLDSGSGSGKTFPWERVKQCLAGHAARFIIAGGLSPENVGQAVHTFTPWGVDVVSGVEREPGRKDPEKLKAFVAAVRKAEARKAEKQ